jgi:hypothetical protein
VTLTNRSRFNDRFPMATTSARSINALIAWMSCWQETDRRYLPGKVPCSGVRDRGKIVVA